MPRIKYRTCRVLLWQLWGCLCVCSFSIHVSNWQTVCKCPFLVWYLCHEKEHPIINTLRQRQNGCHIPAVICKWIFLNEKVCIMVKIQLKFVSYGPINSIPALVEIMDWHQPDDKPLSEPLISLEYFRSQLINCIILKSKLLTSLTSCV